MICTEVEIAVVACLPAKWNVYVNSSQTILIFKFKHYQSYSNSFYRLKKVIPILILGLYCFPAKSQNPDWQVVVRTTDDQEMYENDLAVFEDLSGDSLKIVLQLNDLISEFRSKGHLLANLDSIYFDNKNETVEVWIYKGRKFEWGSISFRSNQGNFDLSAKFGTSSFSGKEVSMKKIEASINDLIRVYENRGYPFSSISWDSVQTFGNRISATLVFDSGPLILYDSLFITGDLNIKSDFLASYLNTVAGKPYSRYSIENIPERLESLDYLTLKGFPEISFQNEEARITLDIEKKPANQFDAIIGFLPNQANGESLLVTGLLDISINNLFRSGKHLELHWDRLQKFTQTLSISYVHPNLLQSQLGVVGDFFLYKQDTSFLNRRMLIGIEYKTGKYGMASIHSRWESSRLITTQQYQNVLTLPDLADYNISYLGVGFTDIPVRGLNYRSGKKWGINFEASAGSKTVSKNSELDPMLYDDIDINTIQYSGILSVEAIYGLRSKPYAIYGKLHGGMLANDQLFLNDLFRLGGLRSIRGFNENTFYASDYVIGTIELRAYFNSISNIFLFLDQAHLTYDISGSGFSDNPLGAGFGISIESGRGLFSFVYAFGRSLDQPFDIKYSKIHFGYKAIF